MIDLDAMEKMATEPLQYSMVPTVEYRALIRLARAMVLRQTLGSETDAECIAAIAPFLPEAKP